MIYRVLLSFLAGLKSGKAYQLPDPLRRSDKSYTVQRELL
jgi:hypothetical protein